MSFRAGKAKVKEDKDTETSDALQYFAEVREDLERLLGDSTQSVGRDLAVLIGATGSGKSTLANYLCGAPMERVKLSGRPVIQANPPLFEVGHTSNSQTRWVQVCVSVRACVCVCVCVCVRVRGHMCLCM